MFDPILSIVIVAIAGVLLAVIIFMIAVWHRTVGSALMLAIVTSIASLAGFFGSFVAHKAIDPFFLTKQQQLE